MTARDYLAWEREQPGKHEYHQGEIFAMAGGSPRHNYLSVAAAAELRAAVRGQGCHVLSADQRTAAEAGGRYVYPDAVVVCGAVQTEPEAADVLSNPRIVVEVLSPGTERYDRGEKWESYQRLPSLRDYLLVSQSAVRVEHFGRQEDGSWRYREHGPGGSITLSTGAQLLVDAIYEGAFQLDGE